MSGQQAFEVQKLFARYMAAVAACGLVGWAAFRFLAPGRVESFAGLIGVAVMVLTGFLSLWLKKLAVQRTLQLALAAAVGIFFVRLILLTTAVLVGMGRELPVMWMVFGFFGEYFVLQVVEIRFVLAVHGQRSLGARAGREVGS